MGIPTEETERVTFQWTPVKTYTQADSRGRPYNWSQSPSATVTIPDKVASLSLPCAVEFTDSRSSSGQTTVGDFDVASIKVTLLDTQYEELIAVALGRPNTVIVDGNTYNIDYWAPPIALFTVNVYTLYASARDES
jgi:hypothetical protein